MTNSYDEQYAVKIKKYSAVIQAQNRYIILKTDEFDQASFFFKRIIKIEAHLNQNFLTLINRFFNTVTVAGSRFVIVLFLGLKSILY